MGAMAARQGNTAASNAATLKDAPEKKLRHAQRAGARRGASGALLTRAALAGAAALTGTALAGAALAGAALTGAVIASSRTLAGPSRAPAARPARIRSGVNGGSRNRTPHAS